MNISCVYSSGGGNTRMVVETIAEVFADAGISLPLINAAVALPDDLMKTEYTILAAPTYDHGVLHIPYEFLLQSAEGINLYTKKYAIVGLGDKKYDNEYNIESSEILSKFVIDNGGRIICDPLKINKSPVDQLDIVRERAHALVGKLKAHVK